MGVDKIICACLASLQDPMKKHHELSVQIAMVGVVDDDPAVRNSLKFSLEIEGLAVQAYANAAELLKQSDLSRFRCLVVDQNMPGLSGIDLVAALRARQIAVPVILITSHPSSALVARAGKERVPIVEKPLLGNALFDKIRESTGLPPRPSPG
jgi:two-component system, LuxR family, response regulator FixJ